MLGCSCRDGCAADDMRGGGQAPWWSLGMLRLKSLSAMMTQSSLGPVQVEELGASPCHWIPKF
jgi:hypothetical protein